MSFYQLTIITLMALTIGLQMVSITYVIVKIIQHGFAKNNQTNGNWHETTQDHNSIVRP